MNTKPILKMRLTGLFPGLVILLLLEVSGLNVFGQQTITGTIPANTVVIVKGAALQTGNIQEWQNNAGTALLKVGSDGKLHLNLGNSLNLWNTANTYSTAIIAGANTSNLTLTLPVNYGSSGYKLTTNGSGTLSWSADANSGGTVTSVGLSMPSEFSVSGSPVSTSGTLTAGWASQTANRVFAAPNGSAGTPTFRALVAADVPTLNQNTTGTAANVTGTVAIANGGTGATTASGARTSLGATTIGANLFTLTNPSAITFPRFNADNTVSSLDASSFRTAIGAGTGSGTVTSIAAGTGLSGGTITSSGTIALANGSATGQLYVTGLSPFTPSLVTMSGDATISAAGALTIANNTISGSKIALGSDATGDIMYYDGTDWTRLAAGTSGQFLKTQGAGAAPVWANDNNSGGTVTGTGSQGYLAKWSSSSAITNSMIYDNGTSIIIGSGSNDAKLVVGGGITIDYGNEFIGTYSSSSSATGSNSVLHFGGPGTGEAIGSNRATANSTQYGLTFFTNSNARMVIENGGNIGIGTTDPDYPLDVQAASSKTFTFAYYAKDGSNNPWTGSCSSCSGNFSIRAGGRITAPEFDANSDARIKKIVGRSNTSEDLVKILALKVTDYHYVDQVKNGSSQKKGFIAQEVETLIPEAITITSDFIPDIFSEPESVVIDEKTKSIRIKMPKSHGLQDSDIVRFITVDGQKDILVSSVVSDNEFIVTSWAGHDDKIFVYGKKVDDFRSVDYDRVFTTGIGAIQELYKTITNQQATISSLESRLSEIDHLKAEIQEMKKFLKAENHEEISTASNSH